MCSYDSLFEIFEQITQHILFLGPSPRKRMQFLAALESSKRELTEIPYILGKRVYYMVIQQDMQMLAMQKQMPKESILPIGKKKE